MSWSRTTIRLTVAALLAGCGSTPSGGGPATVTGHTIAVQHSVPTTAHGGDTIPVSFAVTTKYSDGSTKPASALALTIAVSAGAGLVDGATTTTLNTGTDGTASISWTLGNTIGTQTLHASTSDSSFLDVNVTALAAGATQLAISSQPGALATTGIPLAQQPVLQLRDAGGGDIGPGGVTVTATILSGGGTLGGTTSIATNANGMAAFTNLVLNGVTGTVTLQFTAILNGSIFTATAQPIAVTPPQLLIVTQPATAATSGIALARQPTLQLTTGDGITNLPQAGVVVTATIASGVGTLTGAVSANSDPTGLVTFSGLTINGADGGVTLNFAASVNGQALSVTSQNVAVGPARQIAIVTAPTNPAGSGAPFFVQPVVQLLDADGTPLHQAGVMVTASRATGTSTLGVAAGSSAPLTVATDAAGRTTFHDLALTGPGLATMQFAATGFVAATTAPINVLAPPTITALANAVQIGPLIANAGDLAYYTFQAPLGTLSFDVATFGGTGSTELFVRRGSLPTAEDFDCHVDTGGPSQICTITTNPTFQYYVVVKAVTALSASKLRADAYGPACAPKANIAVGAQITGSLALATACTVEPSQSMHDRYTLTVSHDQAFSLQANSSLESDPIFVAYRLPGDQLNYLAAFGSAPASIGPLLLGAGTYDVLVGDYTATGVTRSYQFSFTPVSANPAGCAPILPSSGPLTMTLTLGNLDCAGTTAGTRSHRGWIVLSSGQTVTITMTSAAFDPLLKVLNGLTTSAGTVLALDNNGGGGTTARLVFTNNDPNSSGTFTIEFTSAAAAMVGDYTMTLNFSPPVYQSPRPPPGAGIALQRALAAPGTP